MVTATVTEGFSLEDYLANPPDRMEWVDGQLVEKTGMTVRHSGIHYQMLAFSASDVVSTQLVLQGFSVAVDEFLA